MGGTSTSICISSILGRLRSSDFRLLIDILLLIFDLTLSPDFLGAVSILSSLDDDHLDCFTGNGAAKIFRSFMMWSRRRSVARSIPALGGLRLAGEEGERVFEPALYLAGDVLEV